VRTKIGETNTIWAAKKNINPHLVLIRSQSGMLLRIKNLCIKNTWVLPLYLFMKGMGK
jgi:hypothetical protein